MEYRRETILNNGKKLLLRHGTTEDGVSVFENFSKTHAETDFLLSYPDENSFNAQQEAVFLENKRQATREAELLAFVDGVLAGTAGIEAVGNKDKVKHRAEFGISILEEYWGMGIGSECLKACIECAKQAGYTQLELDVVADNARGLALYRKHGFIEYGRNPRGFLSRDTGYQELVNMRLELVRGEG